MKRKLITCLLTVCLIFTATMPAIGQSTEQSKSLSYLAIGDSISAGCRNGFYITGKEDPSNPGFITFGRFNEDSSKNIDVYAVPSSFVYRIATKVGADPATSVNGSYVGLRSKHLCQILGIDPYKEGDYDVDTFTKFVNITSGKAFYNMFEDINSLIYMQGIETADLITIELGENDISALMLNDLTTILSSLVSGAFEKMGNSTKAKMLKKDYDKFSAILKKPTFNPTDYLNALYRVLYDGYQLGIIGTGKSLAQKSFEKYIKEELEANNYYFKNLLKYVTDHAKDDAIIVVSTMINPFKDMEFGNFATISSITKTFNDVATPYIEEINKDIKKNATKGKIRRYYVADISEISLNPETTDHGTPYLFHPDTEGQQKIANIFLEQIDKAYKDIEKHARINNHPVVKTVKAAKKILNDLNKAHLRFLYRLLKR
ncbi:MAG: SGNH/GDSL hydrolase family protein [Clostridia bacterium]|nr:SGNH/GDSL hydrolase family protein [Clostridia bacterium]